LNAGLGQPVFRYESILRDKFGNCGVPCNEGKTPWEREIEEISLQQSRIMSGKTLGIRGARRTGWSFLKPVRPDEKLSEITGHAPLTRSELTKRLWDYIRRHRLQDSERKAIIHADEKLKAVFNGKRRVTMFEMSKLVASHLVS
jgi:chromatin remodeling complex protein RSC6